MSRRMPPTPVAAPWYGSTALGWLCDLDLERDRQPVADRDDAGVLARAGDDALARGRQRPEQRLRALVRAVLAPHDAEHRELEVVRVAAAEPVADRVELVVGDARAVGGAAPRAPRRVAARSSSSGAHGGRHLGTGCGASRALDERPDDAGPVIGARGSPPRRAPDGASARRRCRVAVMTPAIARSEPFGFAAAIVLGGDGARRVDVPEQDLVVALQRVERRRRRRSSSPRRGRPACAAVGRRRPARG